ncbi:MAG: hypothetical protein GY801_32695 [bacterium]|nr:hypothetical protein [bacterium]
MITHNISELCSLLDIFIHDENRSLNFAEELEAAFAEAFPEDERFEDFMDVLASYSPGGGAYLFDEKTLTRECQKVRDMLMNEKE